MAFAMPVFLWWSDPPQSSIAAHFPCMSSHCRIASLYGCRAPNSRPAPAKMYKQSMPQGVVLNLAISTNETRFYNADRHVCEVQLVLKCFIPLLQDCCLHTHYLCYRDRQVHIRVIKSIGSLFPFRKNPSRSIKRGASLTQGLNLGWSSVSNRDILTQVMVIGSNVQQSAGLSLSNLLASGIQDHDMSVGFVDADSSDIKRKVGKDEQTISHALSAAVPPDDNVSQSTQLEQEICHCIIQFHRMCTAKPASHLAGMLRDFRAGLHRSNIHSMFFTSKPAASALSKRRFQAVALVWCLYFAYWTFWFGSNFNSTNLVVSEQSNQTFKLSLVAALGSKPGENETLGISEFGLLSDGCKMHIGEVKRSFEYESVVFTFPSAPMSIANGYYFTVSNCLMDACPIQWHLEAFLERDQQWKSVGASTWRFNSGSAQLTFYPSIPFKSHISNGTLVSIDYSADWKWCAQFLVVNIICTLGWMLMVIFAILKQEVFAVLCWESYLGGLSIVYGSLAIANLIDNNWREAVVDCLWVMPVLALSAGVHISQKRLVYHMSLYGVLQILAKVGEGNLFPLPQSELILNVLTSTGFVVVIFCLGLLVLRRRIINKSGQLVRRDCCFYEEVWGQILQNFNSVEELQNLKECIHRIQADDAYGAVQLLRRRSSVTQSQTHTSLASRSIQSFHSMFHDSDAYSGHKTIYSLDQLYFQAHCLHPILLDKVKNWALESNGLFPVRNELQDEGNVSYVKWKDIQNNDELCCRVCWAKVKSVERAIEKVVRTYKHDVSRLVDICRQCIVFESILDLSTCLIAISDDDDVTIMRIKNRLDLAYDANISAGYRDVCVNLRFSSELAQSLGLELHVCEVQLVLLPYAKMKSDDGHKRYVEFRNLRGE